MKRLFFCLIALAFSAAFALEATVVSSSGKVEMQEGGVWIALSVGDSVEKDAVISTGFKSEAVFEVKGSRFTLGPLTRATIEDLLESEEIDSTSIFIESGKISANVNAADGKRVGFKVKSPIATASVRGTDFVMGAGGSLSVNEGTVSFFASGSERERGVDVRAGQESVFHENSGPSNPENILQNNSVGAGSATEAISMSESVGARDAGPSGTSATQAVIGRVNVRLKFD